MKRALLVLGGAGVFTVPTAPETPTPTPFVLLDATEAGAWTEVAGPHAAYADGKTYIIWIGGNSKPNDVEIVAVDDTTHSIAGPILLRDHVTNGGSTTDPDTHISPAVCILPDRIVIAWTGHEGTDIRVKTSNDDRDITAGFSSEIVADPLTGTYTYCQLSYLEGIDRLVLTGRVVRSGHGALFYTHSDDHGATWGGGKEFLAVSATTMYSAFACRGDRIDWAVIDKAHDAVGGYGLWHFYMDETGSVFQTDGTEITGFSYPLALTDLTNIVPTGNDSYPYSVSYTADGRPVITCQSRQSDPVEIHEFRWSGSAWDRHDIDTSDPISGSILSVGGGHHVWGDADRVIHGKVVSGDLTMWQYTTNDDGSSWSGVQLATTSTAPNSPVYVRDPGPDIVSIWFTDLIASDDFDPGLEVVA